MRTLIRRALLAAASAAALAPAALAAQQPIELDNLKTPTSPAFVLLGVEPTSVERPTTPRAFALSLLSASSGEGGIIPENYAAEFAPYWMRPRPRLTFAEYFRPTVMQSLRQTFSVSLATAASVQGADSVTAIGVGFRLAPLSGQPSDSLLKLVQAIRSADSALVQLDIALSRATRTGNAAAVDSIQGLISAGEARARTLSAAFRANDERVGLRMQISGGLAASYAGNDFEAGQVAKTGLWGTLAYRMDQPGIDVIALGRWLRDHGAAEQNAWDLGGRAVLLYERFSGSVEWVARSVSDGDAAGGGGSAALASGNRAVGMLEYRATDDLFVSFSFGQDYPRAGEDGQPLVAILGGQLNLGPKPSVAMPPQR